MTKVLFIDDSEDNINLYKIYFKKSDDILVDYTTCPAKGIEMALEGDYDIFFIDIQMPEINGFEVVEKIHDKVSGIIYALTGYQDSETLQKIEASQFKAFLAKPIFKKDLLKIVENCHGN